MAGFDTLNHTLQSAAIIEYSEMKTAQFLDGLFQFYRNIWREMSWPLPS